MTVAFFLFCVSLSCDSSIVWSDCVSTSRLHPEGGIDADPAVGRPAFTVRTLDPCFLPA